jgi:hypothetical protein
MKWLKSFIRCLRNPDEVWKKLEKDPYELRSMDLIKLCDWIAIKPPGSGEHLLGMNELRRRQELESKRIAYIALSISLAALAISVLKAIFSYFGNKCGS